MLILSGAPALSDFRLEKLDSAVRSRIGSISGIGTRFLHFVDVARDLAKDEAGP